MKFTVSAVVALCAVSVQGFSITMSSYLDNLGATGGLSSFAPSGNSYGAPAPSYGAPTPSYAPAPSYSAPAPAPAPYKSALADAPANSDLNYMASLGGGRGQMKSGPNYSGVSSTFTPTQSVGNSFYLDNLKGATMTSTYGSSPAPAPYQSSFSAPAPAPATTGSYLENLSGGGAAVSNSYSSMQSSFAAASSQPAPASTAGYLSSL